MMYMNKEKMVIGKLSLAHFAELGKNNVSSKVCVVDNSNVPSDKHVDGETWCKNFWGGTWKQTSYSGGLENNLQA